MLSMLRHDLIKHTTGKIPKATLSKIKADFDADTYESLQEEERNLVSITWIMS